jgi:hypothetical protein
MTYGVLAIVIVMAFGLLGMALVLIGEGSDPTDWLGVDDAPTGPVPTVDVPNRPSLRPILGDGSHYLDHVRPVLPLRSQVTRDEFVERVEATTQTRGSARLSPRAADAPEARVSR